MFPDRLKCIKFWSSLWKIERTAIKRFTVQFMSLQISIQYSRPAAELVVTGSNINIIDNCIGINLFLVRNLHALPLLHFFSIFIRIHSFYFILNLLSQLFHLVFSRYAPADVLTYLLSIKFALDIKVLFQFVLVFCQFYCELAINFLETWLDARFETCVGDYCILDMELLIESKR